MELILNPPYTTIANGKKYLSAGAFDNYIKSLPAIIQYLYIASIQKIAVGGWAFEEAIRDYPQYFKNNSNE